jgi:hypothetical protein
MRIKTWGWAARYSLFGLSALLLAMAATAHHSIAGQFDMKQTLYLEGVVSKLDWTNPHVYLYLDVKGQDGATVTWKLETLPVAMMRKAGIKQNMLMTRERVIMAISPARDGTVHLGFILNIKFPDGRQFQFSRDPNGPVQISK